jgi:hypothetical protein
MCRERSLEIVTPMTLTVSKRLVPHYAMCEHITAAAYTVYQSHNLQYICAYITVFTFVLSVRSSLDSPGEPHDHTTLLRLPCTQRAYTLNSRDSCTGKDFLTLI